MDLGSEIVVYFFLWHSTSRLALNLSSRHQKVIKPQYTLFEMMKYSLKWSHYSLGTHFEWDKLSFDDFLVTTWEREVESQRKNIPQIPHLIPIENSTF